MRVALVNTPASRFEKSRVAPTGILALAAWLERHGHEVRIVDAAATRAPNDSVVRDIAEFEPGLVGFGALVTAYRYVIDLTRDVRKALPRTPQVLGGQVAINNVANCFTHMPIDYLINGYGEFPLEKLTRALGGTMDVAKVPGLAWRQGNRVVTNPGQEFVKRLDELPMPAYHLIDMEYYATAYGRNGSLQHYLRRTGKTVRHNRFMNIMGTLGCTDRCTFCVHEQEFVGLKVFSNQYLLEHIAFLNDRYGIDVFGIGEEMFITTVPRAREFNRLMKERFPEVYWYGSTRANHATPEMIAELETGNCYALAYGIESGSTLMLDLMKKRLKREDVVQSYSLIAKSKLVPGGSLMVGNIGETNETIKETISFIREVKMTLSGAYYASAFPGGRTWEWAVERGLIRDTHEYLLQAAQTDHVTHINSNLTPYPDWVLRAWQALINWEQVWVDFRHRPDYGRMRSMSAAERWRTLGRFYVRANRKELRAPVPLLKLAVEAYFAWYKLSRKFYRTARDRQCAYEVDAKGAVLPRTLIVGQPQRPKTPAELATIAVLPPRLLELPADAPANAWMPQAA